MHQLHTTLTTLLFLSINLMIYIATAEASCVTFSKDICKSYFTPEKCLEVLGCTWEESHMTCTGQEELKCYNDPIRAHCNLRGCSEMAIRREEELLEELPMRRLASPEYIEEEVRRIQTIYIIVCVVIAFVVICVLGCYFWNRQRRIEANRPPPNEGGVPVVQNPQYYSATAATVKMSNEADIASV